MQEYLRERRQQGAQPGEPVFVTHYPAAKKFLRRLGLRVLKRKLHHHLFRHSSATYYATKLNLQELCYRCGWKFSSNMPDIYICRAGMETKQLDEKLTQTELSEVKSELIQLEQAGKIKDDRIRQLEQAMQTMRENLDVVTKVLNLKPKLDDVEAALRRKSHLK